MLFYHVNEKTTAVIGSTWLIIAVFGFFRIWGFRMEKTQ